jgi:hypothetical protein
MLVDNVAQKQHVPLHSDNMPNVQNLEYLKFILVSQLKQSILQNYICCKTEHFSASAIMEGL